MRQDVRATREVSTRVSWARAVVVATLLSWGLLLGVVDAQASAAAVPKGVTGFFGTMPGTAAFGTAAGQLRDPRGVAVNQTGNGGTPAGTIYAVDGTNNRVVSFDPSGKFLRAFGADVVAYGPDQANEVQAIAVNATSGKFKLTFNGQPTTSLAATASATEVQAALNALTIVGGLSPAGSVTVTGGPGDAGGTVPYRIVFGGSLAKVNVNQVTGASDAGESLSGGSPFTAITSGTIDNGEIGFEICRPTNGDGCKAGTTGTTGGALSAAQGIVVNQSSGDVYVTEQGNRRVSQFDASGNFIRTFGKDVIAAGFPGNSPAASAVQTLAVTASEGKYRLKFGGNETTELPFSATAAEIQTALQGLASIGAGNVLVSGTGPYTITFAGALANNPEPLIATESGPGEPLVGGTATVVNTTVGSNEFEVCAAGNFCKGAATASGTAGGLGASVGHPAVAPTGAPNAGNLLVADASNRRVQEFSATGAFIRAFGQDVVNAGPSNNAANFEVCTLTAGDTCKTGVQGSGSGQFGDSGGAGTVATSTPNRVAEDASGNIYTVEAVTNFRVQKFTLPGNVVTPQGPFDAADLTGSSSANGPLDVAVTPTAGSNVLVIKAFAAGGTPSCPITGTASAAERRVLEVSSAGALEGTHGTCAGITSTAVGDSGLAVRQSTGDLYLSSTSPVSRLFVLNTGQPAAPSASIINVSGVDAHGATISAFVNPNGPELPYGTETTYKFEYKRSADPTYAPLDGTTEATAGNRTTNKLITQRIGGLQAGTSYDVRLVATKPFGSGSATSTVTFNTPTAAPEPIVTPSVYLAGTTAVLGGAVNPNNSPTSYHFEYVDDASFQASGFSAATSVPSPDASAGSGATAVSVAEEVSDLTPGLTYHSRLVATSGNGSATSPPTTFTVEANGGCENESTREAQVSETLPSGTTGMPDCMALEMVSPAKKENQPIKTGGNFPENSVSVDGDHVLFRSNAALGETSAVVDFDLGDVYIASRGEDGWTTKAANQRTMGVNSNTFTEPKGFAPDLSSWFQIVPETNELHSEAKYQAFRSSLSGNPVAFSPLLLTPDAPQELATYAGSSADASRLYIKPGNLGNASSARFNLGDPKPAAALAAAATPRPNAYVLTLDGDGQPGDPVLLARDRLGKAWGGNCGARVGGDTDLALGPAVNGQRVRVQGAISEDGSRVYFSARSTQPPAGNCDASINKMRILERAETPIGPVITDFVQNECTRVTPVCNATNGDDYFQGASVDGTKVYFTTNRQLVNTDLDSGGSCSVTTGTNTGCDLYLYEKLPGGGHNLVQVSAGDISDPSPGAGARVLNNIAGISTDGSHAYFVAEGVLTTTPNEFGAVAKVGEPNLYLYERSQAHPNGRTVFIGVAASTDVGGLWGTDKIETFGPSSVYPVPAFDATGEKIGGDGHVLLFRSKAQLVPNDADTSRRDVYRYDSETGSLQCVSCLATRDEAAGEAAGPVPSAADLFAGHPQGPAFASLERWVSEDGDAVVIRTAAPLLPSRDLNGDPDEYLWRDGQLTLLPGESSTGSIGATISGDGDSVAFRETEQLLPQDGDSVADMYLLRAGGGFPNAPEPPHCTGETCQEPFPPQPSPPGSASETAAGANVVEPSLCSKGLVMRKGRCVRPPCRKGFVRKKGRCVKRHSARKHHNRESRAAGNRQGGLK